MNTQRVRINIIPGGYLPVFRARQYDHGIRVFEFEVYKNEQRYEIPSGYTAIITGIKPDGTGFSYGIVDGNVIIEDNVIYANCLEQMTAVAGRYVCDLILVDTQNNTIGTQFLMDITDSAAPNDDQISDSDYTMFQQVIDNAGAAMAVNGAKADAEAAAANAQASEDNAAASATLSQSYAVGGTDTRTGEDTDNSKYYSEQSASIADDARTSATSAATSATNSETSATNAAASAANALSYKNAAEYYYEYIQALNIEYMTKFDPNYIEDPIVSMDSDGRITVNHDSGTVNTLVDWGIGVPIQPTSSTDTSANLDNYKSPGLYYCADATTCAMLTNAPFSDKGFRLVVNLNYGGFIKQSAYSFGLTENEYLEGNYANTEVVRYYDSSLQRWSYWMQVPTIDITNHCIDNNVPLSFVDSVTFASFDNTGYPENEPYSADIRLTTTNGTIGVTPSKEHYATPAIRMVDSAGTTFGFIYGRYHDTGEVSLPIGLRLNDHTFSFAMYTDGTSDHVNFNNKPAWRAGLGLANIVKTYTYQYSIGAGGHLGITGTNLGMSTPTGYAPLCVRQIWSGSINVAVMGFQATATGSSSVCRLYNTTSTAESDNTLTVQIVYAPSDLITTQS